MDREDATASCISRAADSSEVNHPRPQQKQMQEQYRFDVFNEVLHRLREAALPEALLPSFEGKLWTHFHRLPACYAMDVNVERAEDVLMHIKLLEHARDPEKRPVFAVRLLQVIQAVDVDKDDSSDSSARGEARILSSSASFRKRSVHLPSLGSSADLEAIDVDNEGSRHRVQGKSAFQFLPRPTHEITISTVDKPKLLNLLTSLLGDVGLDIQEAHAFSTNDGYSLDVFVVNGWPHEEIEILTESLQKQILKIGKQAWLKAQTWSPAMEIAQSSKGTFNHAEVPAHGTDEWEIDSRLLKFGDKVASGSFGDLYRGTYCSQDVAIKVLNPERVDVDLRQEFAHEGLEHLLLGFVRNSIYGRFVTKMLCSFLVLVQSLLAYALLQVVKVADFGVARVKAQSEGVMTAETGTYRWMAPEVIAHWPYNHKADVFSFGVVLWELLTSKLPYSNLTPLQAALGVVLKGLRPTIPENTDPRLAELIEKCWQQDPARRPDFSSILEILQRIANEVGCVTEERPKKPSGGIFSVFSSLWKHLKVVQGLFMTFQVQLTWMIEASAIKNIYIIS
ncbi:TyrKc [Musa troglodytarum]|uniref:TyrKc n=1 Tax=Musa troglodytarum TaxID=320322 RepID=A0A9E7FJS1_9LILI|nr:TyrKc [Musa troglodytarum]